MIHILLLAIYHESISRHDRPTGGLCSLHNGTAVKTKMQLTFAFTILKLFVKHYIHLLIYFCIKEKLIGIV